MSNHNFVDSSALNTTITRTGTVSQGSVAPIPPAAGVEYDPDVHGGSAYFDGSSRLSVDWNSQRNIGTSDFTIEFWVRPTTSGTQRPIIAYSPWLIYLTTDNKISFSYFYGGGFTTATSITVNTWNHYAMSRTSGVTKTFLNGTLVNTVADTTDYNITAAASKIGETMDGSVLNMVGYISDVHWVVGTGRYTTTFTPAVTLSPIANTKLLLKCANAAVFDSRGKMTPIVNGSVTTDINTYKYGNASMSFDGVAGTHLMIPGSTDLWMGTGDFTVEAWIRPTLITGNNRGIFGINTTANNSNGFSMAINASNSKLGIRIAGSTAGTLESTSTISINTWTHVAMVRTGGSVKVYINGTLEITTTTGGSTNFTAGNFVIGRSYSDVDEKYQGYIDDFRVTKGVARYTANFTAPTAAAPKK